MDRDSLRVSWRQIKRNIRHRWGKLSNDDVDLARGRFDTLAGALRRRYGMTTINAEKQLDMFIKTFTVTERKKI